MARLFICMLCLCFLLTCSRCWIDNLTAFVGGIYVPMGISLVYNFIILGLIVRSIRNRATSALDTKKQDSNRQVLRIVIILSCLLGLTWSFSIFVIVSSHIAVQYIFAVLNSLQGVFILIFHIIRSDEVRSTWSSNIRMSLKQVKVSPLELFSMEGKTASSKKSSTCQPSPNRALFGDMLTQAPNSLEIGGSNTYAWSPPPLDECSSFTFDETFRIEIE